MPASKNTVYKMTVRKSKKMLQKADLRVLLQLWNRWYVAPLPIFPFMNEFFMEQAIAILQKDPGWCTVG